MLFFIQKKILTPRHLFVWVHTECVVVEEKCRARAVFWFFWEFWIYNS